MKLKKVNSSLSFDGTSIVIAELIEVHRNHLCYHLILKMVQPAEKRILLPLNCCKEFMTTTGTEVYQGSFNAWGCPWIILPVLFQVICRPY